MSKDVLCSCGRERAGLGRAGPGRAGPGRAAGERLWKKSGAARGAASLEIFHSQSVRSQEQFVLPTPFPPPCLTQTVPTTVFWPCPSDKTFCLKLIQAAVCIAAHSHTNLIESLNTSVCSMRLFLFIYFFCCFCSFQSSWLFRPVL